jgi:hypothetical protein
MSTLTTEHTHERVHGSLRHRSTPRGHRTLELEVVAGGDPVRLAHMLATLVNNSPMALASVSVGDQSAYPVPASCVTPRGPMLLTLRMRDRNQHIDGLLVEQIVGTVSSVCRVVEARRRP